jgi:hypothetical protein
LKDVLRAGTAKIDIVPSGELQLIGTYNRKPRIGARLRDRLTARALALDDGQTRIVILVCDLLCPSEELHQGLVAALPDLDETSVFLAATHTHSSYGGFFNSPATKHILGVPRKEVFDFLIERLSSLARQALCDLAPAHAQHSAAEVPGLTNSRRQADGPHDDLLVLLRLTREGRRPIDLINVSGHPVMVSEHEPNTISGDYPGEFCRRLEQEGSQPIFTSAALGGVSILFPEFAMDLDRHMELVCGLLLSGYRKALASLAPPAGADAGRIEINLLRLPHMAHQSNIVTGRIASALLSPLRNWLKRAMASALPFSRGVPLHILRLGDFLLVGSANELGATLVTSLREIGERNGYVVTMAVSLVDGYAGYIHRAPVYRLRPEKGYRFLALYENSLAMFGWDFGDKITRAVEKAISD